MLGEAARLAGQALQRLVVKHPQVRAVLADIELDRVDAERERVAKAFEAVFEAFAGRAAVADYVKRFTNFAAFPYRSERAKSDVSTILG